MSDSLELNALLNEYGDMNTFLKGYSRPSADLMETKNHVLVSVELPGVQRSNIEIDVEHKKLEVRCKKTSIEEHECSKVSFIKRERILGNFKKVVALPENLNLNEVAANFDNGLLLIQIKKNNSELTEERKRVSIRY